MKLLLGKVGKHEVARVYIFIYPGGSLLKVCRIEYLTTEIASVSPTFKIQTDD